jgi:phosphoglycerol transferase MdoB-like AlkP superfamily enzyme
LPIVLFASAFVVTVGIYSLCRLQFLFWNWNFYQKQALGDIAWAFLQALRFDLSAVSIIAAIPFLIFWVCGLLWPKPFPLALRRGLLGVFVLFQLPGLIVNLGDAEFINFLGRRYTYDALFFFREIPGKFWTLLISYWKLNLLDFAILSLFAFACLWYLPRKVPERTISRKLSAGSGILFLILLGIFARGGLQNKPINFAHAQIFVQPMMNNLVLNSSFTMIQTFKRDSLPREKFFTEHEMLTWLKFGSSGKSLLENHRPAFKPNIILIVVESLNLEYMGRAIGEKGYMPFLDEQSKKGLFFKQGFANARRSIEGIGAIVGGIPSLMNEPFISSQYLTNYFLGAGTLLQRYGYHTSFFHGAHNTSMYFDQFMKSAGIQNYVGLDQYPDRNKDFDGTWGIWDEPFLQFMKTKLDSYSQPFFTGVFTLSSHHPFLLPPEHCNQFPKGPAPIHETLGYTDYSIRRFFEEAEKSPWFKNSIFIITADHTFSSSRPEFQTELGNYQIPFIIYSPNIELPRVDESQVVQQIDVLPTILDLIGAKVEEKNFMGTSIFIPGDRYSVNYWDGRYLFVTKDFFLIHDRGADFQLFERSDTGEKKPVLDQPEKKTELSNRLKAVIQYFSQGMWDNKLYYPSGR